jgi:hypothetical protein
VYITLQGQGVDLSDYPESDLQGVHEMAVRRKDLCRAGVLATVVVLALVGAWGSVATALPVHYRWAVSAQVRGHKSVAGRKRSPQARTAIVGGSQIAISQAPWQVEVFAEFQSGNESSCGGAILDSTHVVTAAHCTFDLERGEPLPASALIVVGGTAHMTAEEIKNNPEVQARFVSEIRVHPMFEFSQGPGTSDDVAVLTLKTPLSFGTSVGQIALSSSEPQEGVSTRLTGFGEQEPEMEPDSFLYSLGMTTSYPQRCGEEADAVFTCASSASGSPCFGDVGSVLTVGEPATLIGLLDAVSGASGKLCQPGADNQFVNLLAPEISDFLKGSSSPPRAPRGGEGIRVHGVPRAGNALTCEPGSWTDASSFSYGFVESTGAQMLQFGPSSTYELTAADVGRTIYCEVQASSLGGTGVARTSALSAIEPPLSSSPPPPGPTMTPTPTESVASGNVANGNVANNEEPSSAVTSTVSLAVANIPVEQNGAAVLKLACVGDESCHGKLTLEIKQSTKGKRDNGKSHNLVVGTASYTISAGATASVTVHLDGVGRALLRGGHGQLAAGLQISLAGVGQVETKTVRLVQKKLGKKHK